jgi:hypothetical protein
MRYLITAITVGIIALWAVWTGLHLFRAHANVEPAAAVSAEPPAASSPSTDLTPAISPPTVAAPTPSPPAASPAAPPAASPAAPPAASPATSPPGPSPAASPPTASPLPAASPAAVENPSENIADALPGVLHQEIPEISHGARGSIRGIIKIAVRVKVDRSGNVVSAALDSRGSSRYFTRTAMDAAKKWKFVQAGDQNSRAWMLHFEFTRAGVTAHAAALR